MTQDEARMALQFLARTTLQGSEAPALLHVMRALEQIANPPQLVAPMNGEARMEMPQ